ncbi:MAG: type IV secretory system conjugative DNA transfer family protein [Oscillospiraceae bacterium]|nr:type IV secretory system conjugative DNA transfer family protein [Oscillospiraceae bacterium]
MPTFSFSACFGAFFSFPYGLIGIAICLGLLTLLIIMVMKMGFSDNGEYDAERNLVYSRKGTYGTAGFMPKSEMKGVLELVSDVRRSGMVLGMLEKQAVCIPRDTRLNGNIAVYGASGSMKTRAYCVNRILQSASGVDAGGKGRQMESLIITDPKSELYEKTSEYLRDKGYVVKVFNLIQPENSDSWNCLAEIEGDELMAQIFCDVIIKNTGSERGDHFWDAAEMNLLKALVLYVEQGYPPESKNIGEVYKLLTLNAEKELNSLFDMLPPTHPAKAPYALFRQSSETVRSGVIIGLGSRLQVFQNKMVCQITGHDEIDLELPGKKPCAYFCITSDQDSAFDFLSSLFLSFVFIKLIRYADRNCDDRALPVPVHVLGEELTACGVIPDLSRKISVIRSRNVSMSCVFQNLAGLQNRYPYNQWQEILGCCDYSLALGCTDELTAKFLSDRTGEVSVHVDSRAKMLGTWRISNYTPEYRETSGVGKRKLLTMDEVLRLPINKALVIIRGKKVLQVEKYDYTNHPEAKKMRPCKAAAYIPEWRKRETQPSKPPERTAPKPPRKKPPATKRGAVPTDKNSIMSTKHKEE